MRRCNVIFKITDDGYIVEFVILFALIALNTERLISELNFSWGLFFLLLYFNAFIQDLNCAKWRT